MHRGRALQVHSEGSSKVISVEKEFVHLKRKPFFVYFSFDLAGPNNNKPFKF